MARLILVLVVFSLIPIGSEASVKKHDRGEVIHNCNKKDKPNKNLACNIVLEAGGEGYRGMIAVGFVTLNRKMDKSRRFPNEVRDVIYQSYQFSWTRYGGKIRDKSSWMIANGISEVLLLMHKLPPLYERLDPTSGSTYYHARSVHPRWSQHLTRSVVIRNHIFYKNPHL